MHRLPPSARRGHKPSSFALSSFLFPCSSHSSSSRIRSFSSSPSSSSSPSTPPPPPSPPPQTSTTRNRRRRARRQPEYDGGTIKEDLVASLPGGWADVREEIKQQAQLLGFSRARITTPEPSSRFSLYQNWVQEGQHGEMGYLAREDRLARRGDLDLILPGVQAVICTMTLYWPGKKGFPSVSLPPSPPSKKNLKSATTTTNTTTTTEHKRREEHGIISCYSWGKDYHDLITPRLQQLAEWTHTRFGGTGRWYVDTGPIMERDLAERAGLGFVGKNTLLINEQLGSGTFLAELLTTLPLPPEEGRKKSGGCGSCRRCVSACPTGAIHADGYSIDARRCISYLTIESKGSISEELRPLMGQLIYGCDICQQVCPWNRWSWPENEPKTFFGKPGEEVSHPMLAELMLTLRTEEDFKERFKGSPIQRIGRGRLLRNVAVAMGNCRGQGKNGSESESGGGDGGGEEGTARRFLSILREVWEVETDALVREHMVWAMERLERGGGEGLGLKGKGEGGGGTKRREEEQQKKEEMA